MLPKVLSRKELDELYCAIPLSREESQLLRQYCDAAANLYGVVPVRQVWEIILAQNTGDFSRKQLMEFTKVARHEEGAYVILGDDEAFDQGEPSTQSNRVLYSFSLWQLGKDVIEQTKMMQDGKDYYIPEKSKFIQYADSFYYEPTEESRLLLQYFQEVFPDSPRKIQHYFNKLLRLARESRNHEYEIAYILDSLDMDPQQGEEIFKLYSAFRNQCRMPCNLGHSVEEMRNYFLAESSEAKGGATW